MAWAVAMGRNTLLVLLITKYQVLTTALLHRVQRALSYLADREQRVFRAGLGRNPFLFRADDVQQQLLVGRRGQPGFNLLLVFFFFQRLASLRMEHLALPAANH